MNPKAKGNAQGNAQIAYSSQIQYDKLSVLKCIVSYNKYGGYCVPISSRHRAAARKILSHSIYEPKTIDFMVSNCGTGDIVHAGAYFGDFFPALSSGISSDAKIWAFEPNSENFRCAKITLEINDISNVILTKAALGSKPKNGLLKITGKNNLPLGGGSRIVVKNTSAVTETVKIVTVDDVVPDRDVSIIQLDVEGYVKEVLSGALETIRRCHPILILEIQKSRSSLPNSKWFFENILNLGYHKIGNLHERNFVYSCD